MADPQHELKRWLLRKLIAQGQGSCRALAEHLGTSPDVVRRMKCIDGTKQCRTIPAQFIIPMAEYFGEWPPGYEPYATDLNTELLSMVIERFESKFPKRLPPSAKAKCIAQLYRYAATVDNSDGGQGVGDDTGKSQEGRR